MHFSSSRRLWIQWTTLIAVGILFIPGMGLRAQQKRRTQHVRRVVRRRHVARHSRARRYHRRYRYHRRRYRARRIAPARVRQIQQALVKTGDLHEKPNGQWDAATRKAMSQYQTRNGFTPTGMPEAKPLMKLGLGPHPLPPALERAAAANARTQEGGGTSVASDSSPSSKSSSTSAQ